MKKTLALTLALLLVLSVFTACSSNSSAAVGTYTCTSMSVGEPGEDPFTADPSAMGLIITLTLNEDGTGTIQYADEEADPEPVVWSLNGSTFKISINGADTPATFENDTIVLAEEDYSMTFTRN